MMETHPCFTGRCSEFARIHLPVAPHCNIQCRYCLRRYSCVNESRPGVVAKVMSPLEAAEWFAKMRKMVSGLTVAGIAGPGDALANSKEVFETFRRVREIDSDVFFCLSTNGFYLPECMDELVRGGIGYITLTINALSLDTACGIYSMANDHGRILRDKEAAALILQRQQEGLELLAEKNIKVKINSVAVPGVNMKELPEIAKMAAFYKAELHNIIPMIPVKDTELYSAGEPSEEAIGSLRRVCGKHVRQMYHCNRCRADAVGNLAAAKKPNMWYNSYPKSVRKEELSG